MDLSKELFSQISSVLPKLEEAKILDVISCLEEVGVEEIEDLSMVKESHLKTTLKDIQISKLMDSWKKRGKFTVKCL